MAARNPSHAIFPALVATLLSVSCERQTSDERQEEQRVLRAERLAQARARRAARARRQSLNRLSMIPGPVSARPNLPAGPCVPGTELKRRAPSAAFNDRFARSVHLVLDAIRADLVALGGTSYQRFTFTVRMHPGDAPRLGRRSSTTLELTLGRVALCGQAGRRPPGAETLRLQLVRLRKGLRPPGTTTALWPHRPGGRPYRIPVGVPIQLLLEPGRPTLAARSGQGSGTLGLWEIQGARFVHRPRYQRLSLASSALPAKLRQIHAVEVGCDRLPDKRCRFLTRQQGRRALVTPWKELLKLAAPIKDRARVLQLHAIDLQLHFPKCGGDPRRPTEAQKRHPCFRNGMVSVACLFWRATAGFGTAPVVSGADPFSVRHVLRCPGKKLRVLQLDTTYGQQGRHRRKVTDLSSRSSQILHGVRRLTSPGRRRR